MSKRRIFDIDFPDDTPVVPAGTPSGETSEPRRGPMAAAITENADALRQRAEAEQAIREENDRLAHEHVRMKRSGLITDLIPLDEIQSSKLTRDRSASVDPELDELKASIRAIGLSNPIRVEMENGNYQLIQGHRRLSAYRALFEETGDDAFAAIPAGIVAHGEALEQLYRRMVDENLVRRDLSFGEMAQLALSFSDDPNTNCMSVDEAVARLYASTSRQKRSYIRHFATLLSVLSDGLKYPEAIPRRLGLDVEKRLSSEEGAQVRLLRMLAEGLAATAEAEQDILRTFVATRAPKPESKRPAVSVAKTTLRCTVPAGTVRCSARNGRVELAMDRDFSSIDRARLQSAIAAFMSALEE